MAAVRNDEGFIEIHDLRLHQLLSTIGPMQAQSIAWNSTRRVGTSSLPRVPRALRSGISAAHAAWPCSKATLAGRSLVRQGESCIPARLGSLLDRLGLVQRTEDDAPPRLVAMEFRVPITRCHSVRDDGLASIVYSELGHA